MSSRIVQPGDPRGSAPVAWRQVGPAAAVPHDAANPAARIAELESAWQQRARDERAAGYAEGEISGRSRAGAELQPVLERLVKSIEEIGHLRARLRREAESDVLQLALAIARRVLRREMAVDSDALHGLVFAALEKLNTREVSRVRVHASHAAQLGSWLKPATDGGTIIDIVADPACQPGDVIFETERGNLDASVDSQLQEIERGLADRLRSR